MIYPTVCNFLWDYGSDSVAMDFKIRVIFACNSPNNNSNTRALVSHERIMKSRLMDREEKSFSRFQTIYYTSQTMGKICRDREREKKCDDREETEKNSKSAARRCSRTAGDSTRCEHSTLIKVNKETRIMTNQNADDRRRSSGGGMVFRENPRVSARKIVKKIEIQHFKMSHLPREAEKFRAIHMLEVSNQHTPARLSCKILLNLLCHERIELLNLHQSFLAFGISDAFLKPESNHTIESQLTLSFRSKLFQLFLSKNIFTEFAWQRLSIILTITSENEHQRP